MVDKNDNGVPKPSMLFFFIATTLYAVVKYNIETNNLRVATLCYVITIIVGHYLINMNIVTAICKSSNWRLAFIVTVVPWVMMFSIIMIVLEMYPGWKAPFSNTFGYALVKFTGAKKLMSEIFPPGEDHSRDEDAKSVKESLAYIYSDQSILINEVTNENFENFWKETAALRSVKSKGVDEASLKHRFKKLVKLKEIVGEYVWYILTGSLVIAVGYNYLVTVTCSPTTEDIKKEERAYESTAEKQKSEEESNSSTKMKFSGQ
jgi:hypothetical protein